MPLLWACVSQAFEPLRLSFLLSDRRDRDSAGMDFSDHDMISTEIVRYTTNGPGRYSVEVFMSTAGRVRGIYGSTR